MADDFLDDTSASAASAGSAARPAAPAPRRGCLSRTVRTLLTLLTILVSAALGAAAALAVLFYGPSNFGVTLPDSTGRLASLEQAQRAAEDEQEQIAATLREMSDVRGSVDTLRNRVEALETGAATRNSDLDGLQNQVNANLQTLLSLQERLNQLESIPANAALAERLSTAELDLATVSATLERLRQALGVVAPAAPAAATPAATSTVTSTPTSPATPTAGQPTPTIPATTPTP